MESHTLQNSNSTAIRILFCSVAVRNSAIVIGVTENGHNSGLKIHIKKKHIVLSNLVGRVEIQ